MSWKKFSSNNNRKGVENNSKQKSSIYASKVFTNDIIVNNEADVGIIDISNLNYTRDTYTSDSINILEFMHGTDISVNSIDVQNKVDTSGVVKIIKPIKAYVGLFNKLKGYDASFERLNVNTINVKNISSIYDGSKIEIKSDVSFNDVVDFEDISMNHFNLYSNNEVIISADISISTLDKSLKFKDASINSLGSRSGTNIIRFDKDISLNGSIFSIGVSADELIVSDMSVNIIEAKDTSVNITNGISVNRNINIDKINLDFIVSDVSIQSDLSINGGLLCNTMKIDGNFGKFDNNAFLEFTDTVSFEKTLVKSDISATTITVNTGSNAVPTNEIIPDNPKNIITYGLNSYSNSSCIVIDGDVSINGKLDAEWDKTGMNIIPTLTSNLDLIKNIDDYVIGQFVILKIIGQNEKIFIKSGTKSWHNLVMGNASPFYTKFELNSNELNSNDRIFIKNQNSPPPIIKDNSYTDLQGLEGTDIVFYVIKTYGLSREIFTLDINHKDPEADQITSSFDNSFSNYLSGAEWGISLENAPGTDFSHVKILPPMRNGFDFSFTVTMNDTAKEIPIEQKIIFKKINQPPQWNHMILSVSNSDLLLSDQSWNTSSPSIQDSGDLSNQFYLYFDHNKDYIYSNGSTDLSSYYLDLSALDPEGFDVSYIIFEEVLLAGAGGLDGTGGNQGTASASSTLNSDYAATKAFNGTLQDANNDAWRAKPSDSLPQSIEFEFPYDVIVTKYKIWPEVISGPRTPQDWTLQGKPFGGTYQPIHTKTGINSWESTDANSITNNENFNEYPVAADTAYRTFMLHMTASGPPSAQGPLSIGELAFYGYEVGNYDLSWAWVDKTRLVIDISDNVESGNDSFLKIISIDDWFERSEREERIVKFKHISSEVIEEFDISENGASTSKSYNTINNSYQYQRTTENKHITIEPSYQSIYSTYFGKYNHFSVNDMTTSVGNPTNDLDIEIKNNQNKNIIDISTSITKGDLSFTFILNHLFKYNFTLLGFVTPITRAIMDVWITDFNAGAAAMVVQGNRTSPAGESGGLASASQSTYYGIHIEDTYGKIEVWNTSNVTDMSNMFQDAEYFNSDIGNWNTSNVTTMLQMFWKAKRFNGDIGNWNTSNVTTMRQMFREATAFNGDIGNWNTSNVATMNRMFWEATNFNKPINTDGNKWNTSNVRNMYGMFEEATSFDKDISDWVTSSVTDMGYMFNDSPFFQDISGWTVHSNCSTTNMFRGSYSSAWGVNSTIVRMNGVTSSGSNYELSDVVEDMKPRWKNGVAGWYPSGIYIAYWNQ